MMFNALLTIFLTFGTIFGVYNYLPLAYLETEPKALILGSDITTINATDLIKDSRATINTNFSNLNSTKIENSTSSVAAITTLANLVSIGTITTGVWNGTVVTVTYGGTGSSTLSANQVLLGNGTPAIKTVAGYGTSGQFLTSNGVAAPTWTTSAVSQTDDYNWTGTHRFKSFNASSTAANPIVLNGVSLNTPSTQGASSTVLTNDGSGNLKWISGGWTLLARQSYGTVASTTISFQPRSRLMVLFDNNGVTSLTNGTSLSFNASSTRYSGFRLLDGGVVIAPTAYGAQTATQWGANGTTSPSSLVMFITNATSSVKKASYTGSFASPTGVAETMSGVINWSGLDDQINQISLNADRWGDAQTNTFITGATLEVYGSDQQ